LKNGRIKPPEFRSSSNCLEGTQTGQGDDDRSTNQLAAAMLFQGPDVELIGDRFIQRLPICKQPSDFARLGQGPDRTRPLFNLHDHPIHPQSRCLRRST
jgi:hypothetical protein